MREIFLGHMIEKEPGKRFDLDAKDKKILYLLSLNARFPTTKIAKIVKLSREVVQYRINRFLKNGLLTGFTTLVNP